MNPLAQPEIYEPKTSMDVPRRRTSTASFFPSLEDNKMRHGSFDLMNKSDFIADHRAEQEVLRSVYREALDLLGFGNQGRRADTPEDRIKASQELAKLFKDRAITDVSGHGQLHDLAAAYLPSGNVSYDGSITFGPTRAGRATAQSVLDS